MTIVNYMNKKEITFTILPSVFWYISFGLFYKFFVLGILISAVILGFLSIVLFRNYIHWIRIKSTKLKSIAYSTGLGLIGSLILYTIFILGAFFLAYLNLAFQVEELYSSIYSVISYMKQQILLYVGLIIIGVFEEIYWRGALQEIFGKYLFDKTKEYWVFPSLYYTFVHLPAFNIALIAAAFVIGFVNGFLASKVGILTTTIAHVLWLEYVIMLPLTVYI